MRLKDTETSHVSLLSCLYIAMDAAAYPAAASV